MDVCEAKDILDTATKKAIPISVLQQLLCYFILDVLQRNQVFTAWEIDLELNGKSAELNSIKSKEMIYNQVWICVQNKTPLDII